MFAPLCVCQRLGHVCLLAASLLYTVNPSFLWHFRPLPPDLCFKVLFPHCCCAIYHSGRVPCGVAATLACVTPEDLAAVASEMEGGTRAGTIGFSDRPGVRALIKTYMESVHSGESWTTSRVYLHVGHIVHHSKRPTTSH